jgi:hypothetical protein
MSLSAYSVDHARRLKYAYLKGGVAAFKDKRINNRERILTKPEREMVIQALQAKQPKDVIPACEVEHWTTGLLGLYISEQFGKHYKKLTWHYPGRVYEKADQAARDTWIKQQSDGRSRLMRAWHDQDTVILCEDEMILTSSTTIQKVWLPRGEYPPRSVKASTAS